MKSLTSILESTPIIPAVRESKFIKALSSPCEVIFLLGVNILSVADCIRAAHEKGELLFIHIDLSDGIGKDEAGVKYLSSLGCDGIITTRAQIIKYAKREGLYTVQRFFTLDSQGLESISDMLSTTSPDTIEIMPGVITKTVKHFVETGIPVIAGGLVETKEEVTNALSAGAVCVSTGKEDLWYL